VRLSRRQFLRLAGGIGILSLPTLLGYGFLRAEEGEPLPDLSPYAPATSTPTDSPILVLTNERADNPFGPYLAEVLRAEGVNCFRVAPLSSVNAAELEKADLVLLAEGPVGGAQAELLADYVAKGGRLVAMRPDARLAFLFGVERMAGNTAEGYWQVEPGHPLGQGIAAETLQYHGVADHYRLAGAQAVAWLAHKEARTGFPAITLHRYGQGEAALWAFDLARSVAYTRQGNPAWADQERDGLFFVRTMDMFVGWVDLDRLAIPQADEQQRLLVNLLTALSQDRRPLPRLWYFPGAAKSVLIATSDSHINPAWAVEEVITRVEQRGGHLSIYYAPPIASDWRRFVRKPLFRATGLPVVGGVLASRVASPTLPQVADWRARGHEFTVHTYVDEGLEEGWRRYWQEFTGLGYGPLSPTARTHAIRWTGWVESARVQATYGIRLNLDYYHAGPAFRKESGEWVYGHFTGSGLPMRFVDEQGRILNIYQQLTQLTDEHLLNLHWGGHVQLSGEAAIEISRMLLDNSLHGAYGAIAGNFHVDPFHAGGEAAKQAARWLEGTLDHAASQGVPIWSALEWLRFTEVRHDADLEEVRWDAAGKRLTMQLAAAEAPEVELTVMLPLHHGEARLAQVEVDGRTIRHREQRLGAVDYGLISILAGRHQIAATYV
jgi:hypothetical protein